MVLDYTTLVWLYDVTVTSLLGWGGEGSIGAGVGSIPDQSADVIHVLPSCQYWIIKAKI